MTKRILSVLLILAMLFSVCACKSAPDDEDGAVAGTVDTPVDDKPETQTPGTQQPDTQTPDTQTPNEPKPDTTPEPEPEPEPDTQAPAGSSEFTVTFDFGYDSKISTKATKNGKVTEPVASREGYDFKGWLKDGKPFNADTVITDNITLTAKWEQATYTIEYILAGGVEGGKNPTTYKMGDTVNITSAPTRDGYTFVGWYIGDPTDAKPTLTLPKDISGNIMVRALWEEAKLLFGTYEQDNDPTTKNEPLEWLAIKEENGKTLLITKYAINCLRFNEAAGATNWSSSSIRKWCNDNFYNAAFSAEEKKSIITTKNTTPANSSYLEVAAGPDTEDNVFLLAFTEGNNYMSKAQRSCTATPYAIAQGSRNENGLCWWWSRSPGASTAMAFIYNHNGSVQTKGAYCNLLGYSVRPAIWVDSAAIK